MIRSDRRGARAPRCSAGKSIKEVADHFDEVIRQLNAMPAVIAIPSGLDGADPGGPRTFGGVRGDRPGSIPGCPSVADLLAPCVVPGARQSSEPPPRSAAHVRSNSATRSRMRSTRTKRRSCTTRSRCGTRRAPLPGGCRQPQPVDRGQGRHDETRNRGPLLILDGELDNTVPWAVANASYNQQKRMRRDRDPPDQPRACPDHR